MAGESGCKRSTGIVVDRAFVLLLADGWTVRAAGVCELDAMVVGCERYSVSHRLRAANFDLWAERRPLDDCGCASEMNPELRRAGMW